MQVDMTSIAKFTKNIARATTSYLKYDLPIYACIACYTAFTIIVLYAIDSRDMISHSLYYTQWTTMFVLLMPILAFLIDAIYLVHRFDKKRTLAFRQMYSVDRIARLLSGVALLMGLMFFQGSFTSLKNVLPVLQSGFPYDQVQADIDSWLHLGNDPWKMLHFVAGDRVLPLIEWNYNILWFVICFGSLFYVCTSPRTRNIRARYILMFMATWVVCGNVLAGLFLSAGPAFYGAVTGDVARFAELTTILSGSESTSSSAANFQAYLWSLHVSQQPGFGSGISAFPSIHVALTMMNAMFVYDASRRYGSVALIYVGVILASSVYLGWHYAIDGYASIILVLGLHYFCKHAFREGGVRGQSIGKPASGFG